MPQPWGRLFRSNVAKSPTHAPHVPRGGGGGGGGVVGYNVDWRIIAEETFGGAEPPCLHTWGGFSPASYAYDHIHALLKNMQLSLDSYFKRADTLHARTSSLEQNILCLVAGSSGWCVVAGHISAHPPQQLREPIANLKEAGVDVGVECVPESGCETKS